MKHPRQIAKELGQDRYHGKPHYKCGTSLRYTQNGACIKCKLDYSKTPKALEYFRKHHASTQYRDQEFDRQLRERYGITLDDYNRMFEEQNGLCAICGKPDPKRRLCVDHNHTTNKVRKLLCSAHNLAIGGFKDNPVDMMHAAAYMLDHFQ